MVAPNSAGQEWDRFESWLAENARASFEALSAPADVECLAQITGGRFPLHPDLHEILVRHDGAPRITSGDAASCFIPPWYSLYSAEYVTRAFAVMIKDVEREALKGRLRDMLGFQIHPEWVPFAASPSGELLLLDHRGGKCYGNVLSYDDGSLQYDVSWVSLKEMLSDVNEAVMNGSRVHQYLAEVNQERQTLEWYNPDFR